MKEVFEININNLIYLFTYVNEPYRGEYTSLKKKMYIDRVTGKLISQTHIVLDPFSTHIGSEDFNYSEMAHGEFQDILIKYDIKERTKFQTLNKNNWSCWLKEKGYAK